MAAVDTAVPDAVAPPPGNRRFPHVDALRAIAVLCVVGVHVATVSVDPTTLAGRLLLHLNIGVTIFFLISGFLLYRPFIAHRAGGPKSPRARDYTRRRFLRIIPAYWLVLVVVILLPDVTATSDGHWLQQFGLVFTLSSSAGWACADCGLSQTWSLAIEMTFYVALPFYALLAERLTRGRSVREWLPLELGLLALLALVTVLLQFVVYDGFPPAAIGGSAIGFTTWFALGMALALVSVALGDDDPRPSPGRGALHAAAPWVAALTLYVLLSLWLPDTPFITDTGQLLVAFLAFGLISLLLLIPAILRVEPRGLPARILSLRPLAWLGLVSYGIFLWHIAVLRTISSVDEEIRFLPLLALTLAITIPIAAASYYLLERPILRFKNGWRQARTAPRN